MWSQLCSRPCWRSCSFPSSCLTHYAAHIAAAAGRDVSACGRHLRSHAPHHTRVFLGSARPPLGPQKLSLKFLFVIPPALTYLSFVLL